MSGNGGFRCAACHELFASLPGFDSHRVYGGCVPPASVGLVRGSDGCWQSSEGQPRRRDAPSGGLAATLTAPTPARHPRVPPDPPGGSEGRSASRRAADGQGRLL